jgi:hypothetical protein
MARSLCKAACPEQWASRHCLPWFVPLRPPASVPQRAEVHAHGMHRRTQHTFFTRRTNLPASPLRTQARTTPSSMTSSPPPPSAGLLIPFALAGGCLQRKLVGHRSLTLRTGMIQAPRRTQVGIFSLGDPTACVRGARANDICAALRSKERIGPGSSWVERWVAAQSLRTGRWRALGEEVVALPDIEVPTGYVLLWRT